MWREIISRGGGGGDLEREEKKGFLGLTVGNDNSVHPVMDISDLIHRARTRRRHICASSELIT